jgi:hypothetical protein
MQRNLISRVILNLPKGLCVHPGDICAYDSSSKKMSIYRGGNLMAVAEDLSAANINSFIDMKWLKDTKESEVVEKPGVREDLVIPMEKKEQPPVGGLHLDQAFEVAPVLNPDLLKTDDAELIIPMEPIQKAGGVPLEQAVEQGIKPDTSDLKKPQVETVDLIPDTEEEELAEEAFVIHIEKEEGVGAASDIDGDADTVIVDIDQEPEVVTKKKSKKKA